MIRETLETIRQDKEIENSWNKKYNEILSRNRVVYSGVLLNREVTIHSTFLCYEYTFKGVFILHSKGYLLFIGNKESGYWQEISDIKNIERSDLYEYTITKSDFPEFKTTGIIS